MNHIVKDFFEWEMGKDIQREVLQNGTRYLTDKCDKFNRLHEYFAPITDEQIDRLQNEVNAAQRTAFVFPGWYRDFLRTANGCNLYFGCISLYGEQTPLVWSEKEQTYIKAMLDRGNPDWMAPYDLRFTDSVKYDSAFKERWLTIGSYQYDGTQIVWDYKTEKVVAMYRVPVTLPLEAKKSLKEADFEKMICQQWDSFDEFFVRETKRLDGVIAEYGVDRERGFIDRDKTLPTNHKNYRDGTIA